MEEKPISTMSELDLDQLLSNPCQIPHSVEAVLRKVDAAELDRAKRDVAEQLLVILTSVNMALYRMRLATDVEEEEELNASQHQEEKKKRSQKLLVIRAFQQSSLDKESDLGGVLHWLQDINEELVQMEEDEDFQEVQDMTVEWVEDMEKKIQTSMSHIQACVLRLHQLCGSLLELDTQKTKKKEAAISKGGVWRWWRESKVDTRTILKNRELQPPSVDRILADPSLGAKSASDLGYMLGDISLSCNKAMSMAFRFIQTGLQNLNEALQERTREAHRAQAQLDELKAADAHANLVWARTELEGMRRRLAKMEEENKGLKEENAAHLFQIRQLQGAPRGHQAPPIIEVVEQLVEFPLPVAPPQESSSPAPAKPLLPKRPSPPKKQSRGKEAPVVSQLESSRASSLAAPEGEHEALEVDVFEGVTYKEETPPSPESMSEAEARPAPSLDSLDMLEAMEKKSTSLLADFQYSVFSIIEKSLSMRPGAAGGGLAGEMQGMGLEADKANDAIKLYIILQNTIRDSFNNLTSRLQGQFTDSVLEMPFLDNRLGKAGFWDDTSKSPGEILKEINQMFIRHERDIQSVDSSVRVLMSDKKAMPAWSRSRKVGSQRRHSLSDVLGQLKNINDMSKQQACKMRLALESLLDMQQKMQKEPVVDQRILEEEEEVEVQPACPTSIPSSDSLEEEDIREEKRWHQAERPARVDQRARRASPDKTPAYQRPIWPRVRGGSTPKEDLKRYRAEMEEGGEKIQKTVMVGAQYHVVVASQRTNLHLLRQAAVDGSISSELYSLARQLIRHNRSLDQARLACLLQKFMAFRSVQQVRYNLNMQLLAARKLNDGQTVKDMYSFLIRLDQYQNRVLVRWNGKQAEIDQTRRTCLAHMLYLFTEIRQDCNLPLASPIRCSSQSHSHFLSLKTCPRRTVLSFSPRRRHRPCPRQAPPTHLATLASEVGPLSGVRKLLRGQLPALWCSSLSMSSLARKQPTSPASFPSSPASFPSIPQLLEIDINRSRNTAFCSALDRVATGPQLLAWGGM